MMPILQSIKGRIPEPVRRFWRDTVAPRPIAAGAVAAVAAGVAVGGFLAAGEGFEPPPPMQPVAPAQRPAPAAPQPITFMKGADGKVPDWVVGTDNIPGRETWRDRLPVRTVPDDEDLTAAPRRGLGWLLQPWLWGREAPRPAPRQSRPAGDDRRMDRQAVLEQYERDRARYERERQRWEQEQEAAEARRLDREDRRPRYDPRYPPAYEPRPGRRDDRDYDPEEEAPYVFQQPPERRPYGR